MIDKNDAEYWLKALHVNFMNGNTEKRKKEG